MFTLSRVWEGFTMHQLETVLLLKHFQPEEVRRALVLVNYELKLEPMRATKLLAVVGFDLAALLEYSNRRYALAEIQGRIEAYAAALTMRPVDLAVCRSIWKSIDGYREKLLVLMTECEVVKKKGKNSPNLLSYLERGKENASS
jgi:hypothetical protein